MALEDKDIFNAIFNKYSDQPIEFIMEQYEKAKLLNMAIERRINAQAEQPVKAEEAAPAALPPVAEPLPVEEEKKPAQARPGPQKDLHQGRSGLQSRGSHHRQHHHLLPVRQGGLLPDFPPSGQPRHQCGRVQIPLRLSFRAEADVPEFRSQDAAQCPKGPAGSQGKAAGRKRLTPYGMASSQERHDPQETNKGMPTGIPLFYFLTNRSRRRHAPAPPPQRDQGRYARRANMGTGL